MARLVLLVTLLCAIAPIVAQFVPAPQDLISTDGYAGYQVRYKEVPPSICETTEGVRSYSGYVDIAPDQHLFFWFFEARNRDPTNAPLTLWLNGGPGDPSLVGLFSENGPCTVDRNGDLQYNAFSWNNVSNMIYIDQPTQVGLSYSIPVPGYIDPDSGSIVTLPDEQCPDYAVKFGTCGTYSYANYSLTASTTPEAAPNIWRALQGFMGAFPQYARNGVNLATESYGGHYGPIFAEYFEKQNEALIPGAHKIDFRSLSIANGWYDPIIQYPAYYNYTVSPGNTYDFRPFNRRTEERMYNGFFGAGNCLDQLRDCNERKIDEVCSNADNFCYGVETIFDSVTGRDEYDIRELMPDPFPPTYFVEYLNRPHVQKALGAYQNFSYAVTNLGAGTVANAFAGTGDDARKFNIVSDLRKLLEKGVSVLQYAGDADYICNWIGGEAVAEEMGVAGFDRAGYEDLKTDDGVVHGAVKQVGRFSFARVYDSGHWVSFYKPLTALRMFERMLEETDIATGKKAVSANYRTTGPKRSMHRNGDSTIQREVTGENCTYDRRTNEPRCPSD
jgi:carboxypeptidase C (cathepsin A)